MKNKWHYWIPIIGYFTFLITILVKGIGRQPAPKWAINYWEPWQLINAVGFAFVLAKLLL